MNNSEGGRARVCIKMIVGGCREINGITLFVSYTGGISRFLQVQVALYVNFTISRQRLYSVHVPFTKI